MNSLIYEKAFSTYKTHHQANNGGRDTLTNIDIVNNIFKKQLKYPNYDILKDWIY